MTLKGARTDKGSFVIPPKTRAVRAKAARGGGLAPAEVMMREFFLRFLQAYEALRETELETRKLGDFLKAQYGFLANAKAVLGDVHITRQAFVDVQGNLCRN
jgi:hypothetical protein